jgi:hypothetical protein
MRFLQYPWRWALVVEAPMAIFFAASIWPAQSSRRRPQRVVAAVCALVFLAATLFAARYFLRACEEGDTVAESLELYRGGKGIEGTDEYEPPDADHWKVARGLPDACFSAASDTALGVAEGPDAVPDWRPAQGTCEAVATAQTRQPEHLRIEMAAPHAGYLILRLSRFPAWRITVNHAPARFSEPRDDGLIAVSVPAGPVELTADWTTTPDVVAGRCVSAFALLLLMALRPFERRLARLRVS